MAKRGTDTPYYASANGGGKLNEALNFIQSVGITSPDAIDIDGTEWGYEQVKYVMQDTAKGWPGERQRLFVKIYNMMSGSTTLPDWLINNILITQTDYDIMQRLYSIFQPFGYMLALLYFLIYMVHEGLQRYREIDYKFVLFGFLRLGFGVMVVAYGMQIMGLLIELGNAFTNTLQTVRFEDDNIYLETTTTCGSQWDEATIQDWESQGYTVTQQYMYSGVWQQTRTKATDAAKYKARLVIDLAYAVGHAKQSGGKPKDPSDIVIVGYNILFGVLNAFNWILEVMLLFHAVTRKIELILRGAVAPIAFQDVFQNGPQSLAMRYAKKFFALLLFGAAMMLLPLIAQALQGATVYQIMASNIESGGADLSGFFSVIITCVYSIAAIASISTAKTVINDAVGS